MEALYGSAGTLADLTVQRDHYCRPVEPVGYSRSHYTYDSRMPIFAGEHYDFMVLEVHLTLDLGEGFFDTIICNTQTLSAEQEALYSEEKIAVPATSCLAASPRNVLARPLLAEKEPIRDAADALANLRSLVRHDPRRVAEAFEAVLKDLF